MKHIFFALTILLVSATARANPRCKVSAAPADAFKDVTGAKADAVESVTGADGDLIVGTWTAGHRHKNTAAYVVVKGKDRCSGAIVELGEGDAVHLVGRTDLDGAGVLWNGTAWSLLAADAAAKATHPAAIVTIAKGTSIDVALLELPPTAGRVLARTTFSSGGAAAADVSLTGSGTPRDLSVTVGGKTKTLHWKKGAYSEK